MEGLIKKRTRENTKKKMKGCLMVKRTKAVNSSFTKYSSADLAAQTL